MSELVNKEEQFTDVIAPHSKFFDLHLGEVWRYKDLLMLFVKRDFIAQYKQTILGPLWHFVQPIFTTVMFLLVFTKIANIPTDGIPPVLFYMSGITIWNYFAVCFSSTSNTFTANASIFGKVYFPRLVMPLSVVISNIIKFLIQFALLGIVMVYYHFNGYPLQLSASILLLPVLLVLMALLGLGLGIIISSLTTKYRDLSIFITFGVQLLMYATPVVYPLSFLMDKSYKWVITVNPLSSLVEGFRYALFSTGGFEMSSLLYSTLFTAVALFVGLLIFSKVERSFMDTV